MSDFSMGSGAHVKLAGGIIPSHVVIYVGGNSIWGNSTGLSASVITLSGILAGTGTFIDGVVLAGGGVNFGPNTTSNGVGFDVPGPSQECQQQMDE
jgi:hypothetical protein